MSVQTEKALILVVDDETAIRDFVKTCLEVEGFDVITAANGVDGLERYKENKNEIRLIVTDLDMPAMNGDDMIRHISEMTPAIKVIVTSGRSAGWSDFAQQGTAARCLPKPYSPRDLRNAVKLLL